MTPYQERKAAVAAVNAMHAARPLRPPPVRIAAVPRTAGQVELAREIRRGTYAPHSGSRWLARAPDSGKG